MLRCIFIKPLARFAKPYTLCTSISLPLMAPKRQRIERSGSVGAGGTAESRRSTRSSASKLQGDDGKASTAKATASAAKVKEAAKAKGVTRPAKVKETEVSKTKDADEADKAESRTKKQKVDKQITAKTEKSSEEVESLSAPVPKSKTDYEAADGIPRNTSIPDPLVLDAKPEGTTRIASWNILSLKSALGKGLLRYVEAENADVLFFSETKCNDVPMVQQLTSIYPHQTWGIGKTKGYAGVALLSKIKPLKVTTGLPSDGSDGGDADTKGRIITAEYERFIVCGTYVVNAGEGLKSMSAKIAWNKRFARHLAACDARKPTIWTGDLNVVLDPRDLSKASQKWNKSPGYTAIECNHHRSLLNATAVPGAQEYVDIWRERNPEAIGHFTFYGFRGMCRAKGIGWRLDTFIVPKRIQDEVVDVGIRHSVYGASDHVPVYLDIKGTL